jgi:hypothetical protein
MNRRHILFAALAMGLTFASAPARADDDDDEIEDIIEDLREDWGFERIEVTTSLLGRAQIRASNAMWVRELVVNPRTGEVLRDVWFDTTGKVIPRPPKPDDDDDDDDDRGGRGHGGDDDDDD